MLICECNSTEEYNVQKFSISCLFLVQSRPVSEPFKIQIQNITWYFSSMSMNELIYCPFTERKPHSIGKKWTVMVFLQWMEYSDLLVAWNQTHHPGVVSLLNKTNHLPIVCQIGQYLHLITRFRTTFVWNLGITENFGLRVHLGCHSFLYC